MRYFTISSLLLGALALALALFISARAPPQARADTSITVTPSLVELEAAPGGSGEQEITVSNSGDEPFSAIAVVKAYPGVDKDDLSAEEFLEISPERISLEPGEEQSVTVDMQVQDDIESGGRYALISLRTDAETDDAVSGSGAATSGEVGVPLLFTIQGSEPITKEAEIAGIVPRLLEDGTVGFEVEVENRGNIHFSPEGELDIVGEDGQTIDTLEVTESPAVIPGTTRTLGVTGSVPTATDASYTARVTLDYEGEEPATDELTFAPEARLSVEELSAEQRAEDQVNMRLVLANEGDVAIDPQVRLDVFNSSGSVGSATPERPIEVAPGGQSEIDTDFPVRLGPGEYSLNAGIIYGDGQELEQQATFNLSGPAAEAQQPGAPEAPVGMTGPNWAMILGMPLGIVGLLAAAILWVPPFKPVRQRLSRAWRAFGDSE